MGGDGRGSAAVSGLEREVSGSSKRMAKSRGGGTGHPGGGKLSAYREKRDFAATPEPAPEQVPPSTPETNSRPSFVVQKHDATRLHYDVRLEIAGVMMSFAVPKGPSYDPDVKRIAIETEDHPISYNEFEGRIPDGNYGAGDVLVWDAGTYETVPPGQAEWMRSKGHLHVRFYGEKLAGEWHFVRLKHDRSGNDAKKTWLFFKANDPRADKTRDVVTEAPASILSGKIATRGPMRRSRDGEPEKSRTARALLDEIGEPMQAMSGPLADAASYVFEIKYDGYRILAARSGAPSAPGSVRLESRRGHDWSERFQPVADAIAALSIRDAVLDGEVCAVTPDGKPSFQRLQQWVGGERRDVALAFAAFDLLWLDGRDLRKRPLEERRELLRALIMGHAGVLSFSTSIAAPVDARGRPDVKALIELARGAGLEGFIAKKKGSTYASGKVPWWIKLKAVRRQELAVAGYTPLSGTKSKVAGALILAVNDGGTLRYAGRVGSGLDDATRRRLAEILERDRVSAPSIVMPERIADARWSKPSLVAEVGFLEWSDDGKLRHPTFLGLREDKEPLDCVREDERAHDDRALAPPPPTIASTRAVRLANPGKVLYPRDGITKREILAYYESVAEVMLPHLAGRPLTLQRWPDGIDGEQWYQQHPPEGAPPWIRVVSELGGDGKRHLICDDVDGLRWLANLAALTLHQWSAHVPKGRDNAAMLEALHVPDYVVIDLDPGVGPWSHVIDVALALRVLLEKLDLPSVVKTTGKRGLHIFVPFAPGPTHREAVRLAEHLATALATVLPAIATIERAIPRRRGRLYVDFLQNGEGKTVAAPYTLRALDGAPVSTPVRWSEVNCTLDPSAFTLRTVRARIDAHGDLFAGALARGPDVRPLLARLG